MIIKNPEGLKPSYKSELSLLFKEIKKGREIKSITYKPGRSSINSNKNECTLEDVTVERYLIKTNPYANDSASCDDWVITNKEGPKGIFCMNWITKFELENKLIK